MAAVRRATNTVERKIHFYRANAGLDASTLPSAYDVSPFLREIAALAFNEAERYLPIEEGEYLCAVPASLRRPYALRFWVTRRSGLPQVERNGQLDDLDLPARAGLAEAIHVVFFGHNIVGADFNFYGPRMSRLTQYLAERTASPPVRFEPLLRQDVIAQVGRLADARLVRLRVNESGAAIARRADRSLFDALDATLRDGRAEEAELVLRMAPHSRQPLHESILQAVKRLVRMPELRETASAFQVRGFDPEHGRVELIDVLRDYFVVPKQFVRESQRGRAIVSDSAFEAIKEAYRERERALLDAASLGVTE